MVKQLAALSVGPSVQQSALPLVCEWAAPSAALLAEPLAEMPVLTWAAP